jgi:hypothetical protein
MPKNRASIDFHEKVFPMTKYIATAFGTAFIAAMGFSLWPTLWQTFGIVGGWMAAVTVVPIAWYMNHRCGLIYNRPGVAWVDMAWGIAVGGLVWAVAHRGIHADWTRMWPSLCCAIVGGTLGGIFAEVVKKHHPSFQPASAGDATEGE